jgi:WD40 repeat protein/subtilisin-like proprotein convertase family protein
MPSVIQPAEFFVVGGPVKPERSCYVERAADRRLEDAVRARRLCCVLGPRAIGKSSLLHRVARTTRAAGGMAATLDLRPIAEHGSAIPADWLQLVAERIAAGLELGVDVRAWWSAGSAPGENRLLAFFWEIVLTNTTAPIAVLIDDVDAVLELQFAADFFGAIGECHARRGREPDFARLSFVLAGCTTQRELAETFPDCGAAEAAIVEPEDFTPEQAYTLAVAFGGVQELAQALMDRICAWTGGHPYLTQRVARGVARKGGRLEDVERVVREQLLELTAAARDPLLAHVRASLGDSSRTARRATKLLQQLAAGAERAQPTDVAVRERLWLSGTVRADGERFRIRNRIFKELVAAGWLKTNSGTSKWLAAAAAALVAIAAGGYWYTQRLPVADIEVLTNVVAEPAAVEAAYRRLRALPGFEQRADELWRDALGRQSRAATTLAAAAAADTRLRELPGQEQAADRLLGEFWLRRARERAHSEQREAAILLAQRAAELPSADPAAALYLAELAGDDWSRLERSLRLASVPEYWHMSFDAAAFVSIDADRRASRTPFDADADVGPPDTTPVELTALAHSALIRELGVEGEGTAGAFELSLAVQHPAAGELLVTLTAPSGAVAAVNLPRSDGAAVETLSFEAVAGSPLAQLADEAVRGAWRLTVVDRTAGNTGSFGGWGLRFADTAVRDDLPELRSIPDPSRTNDVNVRAVADRAVAWPVSAGVVGTLAVWNLATGQLEHDLALPAAAQHVALDATGARLLAATDRVLTLWSIDDGALVARVGTETEFVLPPVFSAEGGYVAIAERLDGANPLYSVLRSADGSLVGTIEGAPDVQGWELGPGGRYVALQGPETVVRVLEARRGAELRRLPHAHAVERLLHSTDGAALVTVDRAGAIASWPLALASAALGRPLGRTAAAASVSSSADGRRIAYTRDDGAVAVLDVTAGAELYRLRLPRGVPVTITQLSADGTELVTQSGAALKRWRLPPKPVTPRTRTAAAAATAVALDRASDVLAVGLASGQLQLVSGTGATAPAELSFFGHRGAITAAALNGDRALVATGGSDGIVRVWDLASGVPTGAVARPADAPITIVVLSADGRYVASAAARTVLLATVVDGRVTAEIEAESSVTALAFAPDAARIAVGDAAGVVVIAPLDAADARQRATARRDAAVTSLAFSPDGARLAAADAAGGIALLSAAGAVEAEALPWRNPVRWVEFSPEGSAVLAATDAWVHALSATTATAAPVVVHSRLVLWPASSTVATAISPTVVGYAGVELDGAVVSDIVDVAAAPIASSEDRSALVGRDWQAALGMRLNDNGEPVAFDP